VLAIGVRLLVLTKARPVWKETAGGYRDRPMRKSWPFALAVVAVGVVAGSAIAGRPTAVDHFQLPASNTTPAADPAPFDSTAPNP
jgi:hypothetical protein